MYLAFYHYTPSVQVDRGGLQSCAAAGVHSASESRGREEGNEEISESELSRDMPGTGEPPPHNYVLI